MRALIVANGFLHQQVERLRVAGLRAWEAFVCRFAVSGVT
jgi:hypothetical protein